MAVIPIVRVPNRPSRPKAISIPSVRRKARSVRVRCLETILKRGVFRSIQELKHAIHSFIADTNAKPKPFIWTKDPDKIIAAAKRGHQALDSIH
jgi:hypothetical protein